MKKAGLTFLTALFAMLVAPAALAQYIWLDHNNVKQFSDQPPPASIPASRILKTPRGKTTKTIHESEGDTSGAGKDAAAPAPASKAPLSTAEKNAEFNKRRMEQAEKDKKAEAEAKRAKDKTENCERARQAQRTLQSGQRIVRSNEAGEREVMSDDDRARESRHVDEALKECN